MNKKLLSLTLLILSTFLIIIIACTSPKFELSNMTITPNPVGAGDEITITADVANIGNASGNYTAVLNIDEETVQEKVVSVDPGITESVIFNITIKDIGYYYVNVGDLTGTLDVKKPAELVLGTPIITPAEVLPGETATVQINGHNIGGVVGIFNIDLSANGEVIRTKEVTIDGGETISISFEMIFNVPGSYDLEISDDHLDLKVLKPAEFQIATLKISPEEPVTKQDILVSTKVSNLGDITGTHTVSFSIDGKIIESREVELDGGESTGVNFRFMVDLGGKYDIAVNNRHTVLPISGPRYGGSLMFMFERDYDTFDDAVNVFPASAFTMQLTNEELVSGDWIRGPAGGYGTGETTWARPLYFQKEWKDKDLKSGSIAESWEISEAGTITFHIRKGIHYSLDKDNEASSLVNGRELTAEDVVFSLKRVITDRRSYVSKASPQLGQATVFAPDNWTVMVSVPGNITQDTFNMLADYIRIVPPELIEKYGDMNDWRNSVGTGPFILTDYNSIQGITLEKNNNYWMTDPIGPGVGNQLPYIEEIKIFIIADRSTRIAAFRTGKVDQISLVKEENLTDVTQNGQMSIFLENDHYQSPRYYNCWQPWLKNYSGEYSIGYHNHIWPQYVWLDLDLKEEMGY